MVARKSRKPVSIASSEAALSFVRKIQEQFAGRILQPKDRAALREQLAKVETEELRSIARRIMVDLVAPPVQPRAVKTTAKVVSTTKRNGPSVGVGKKITVRAMSKPAK